MISAPWRHRPGVSGDRITNIQNAIDTRRLVAARDAVPPARLEAIRRELGITSRNVGLYTVQEVARRFADGIPWP
jgi:hypothetical protein